MARSPRYDRRFYDTIRDGCRTSAEAAAPIIVDRLNLDGFDIVDVGCGEGWWGTALLDQLDPGGLVVGLDGPGVSADAPIRRHLFHEVDLAAAIPSDIGRFDLAVCLEVAEHLPAERAESFVADLCRLAPVVVFSAAMPGQGGTGHINCQPPTYWADLFVDHDFAVSGALRFDLWENPDVEPWYRSNLLVATINTDHAPGLFNTPLAHPWHLVAPDLWLTR